MQIKTEQFEGPLALLLQLIEEEQLDVSTMALARVTEQFLAYIKNLQDKNPINLADFLIIAAKLLVIKSKSLLPTLELGEEEEEAAFDLTTQLLRYKKYKEAAKYLKKLDLIRHQSWTREAQSSERITFLPDPDISIESLALSLHAIALELKEIIRLPELVMQEVMSISDKIAQIQILISDQMEISLSHLLKNTKNKTEVIVTFLALLELTKQRILSLEQSIHFGDIVIKKTQPNGTPNA